jgi:hypothetical protein
LEHDFLEYDEAWLFATSALRLDEVEEVRGPDHGYVMFSSAKEAMSNMKSWMN